MKTPLENNFIDFNKVFTRHKTNPRHILNVTSPYYMPKIRHYKDLMSLEALKTEAKFLSSVKPDPHIYKSKQYYNTYTKYCNKVLKDLYTNEDLTLDTLQMSEIKYLKYLSKKLEYDNNRYKQIQSKYVAAKFYGQLLDLTNFSDDNEKTNAN